MKTRYIITLILITAAMLGWTFIQYQHQQNRQFRLKQLSTIPVYVYHDVPAFLDSLALAVKTKIPQVDSLIVANMDTDVQNLVKEYQLDIEPTTLRDFSFPTVLTINFKPISASFGARDKLKGMLSKLNIASADIDMQEAAWNLVKKELDFHRRSWSNTTLFAALMLFVLFIFARLYLLLYQQTMPRDPRETILATIRRRELGKWQNAILVLLPLGVNLIAYQFLVLVNLIEPRVDLLFFVIQTITLLTAGVTAYLLDMLSRPEAANIRVVS